MKGAWGRCNRSTILCVYSITLVRDIANVHPISSKLNLFHLRVLGKEMQYICCFIRLGTTVETRAICLLAACRRQEISANAFAFTSRILRCRTRLLRRCLRCRRRLVCRCFLPLLLQSPLRRPWSCLLRLRLENLGGAWNCVCMDVAQGVGKISIWRHVGDLVETIHNDIFRNDRG